MIVDMKFDPQEGANEYNIYEVIGTNCSSIF